MPTIEPIQLGTLLSICSAIGLAVVGFVRTRLEDRRRYTLGVLMGYSQSTELLKALHVVREHRGEVDGAIAEHLAIILPHFQSIALAAKSGLLDRDIMIGARYGTMQAIWKRYGRYVADLRDQLERPLLYVELEEYLAMNADRYNQYAKRYSGRRSVAPTRVAT